MTDPEPREQRLVFGEVADQYDRARPSYPDALFDTIIEHAALGPGATALEIGAGTGKATRGFIARGLRVHALEPSPEMARVLRDSGAEVEESTFEAWTAPPNAFRLLFAAQAWHWVHGADRYEKAAAALTPGGTFALFWNKAREWEGALGDDNNAAYDAHAPALTSSVGKWELDRTLDEMAATDAFTAVTKRVITWTQRYTADEWVTLLGTHSDHRILPDDQRARLHDAVRRVIDAHGGTVDTTYEVMCYLATRK